MADDTQPSPAMLAFEQAIVSTLSAAIPAFTQAGLTALMQAIVSAVNKHNA